MPIFPAPPTNVLAAAGVLYASNFLMPAAEGDLYDGVSAGPDPIPLPFESAITAAVEVTANVGGISGYVVMQTDLGDGVWFDAAWCVFTAAGNFILYGSTNVSGAFQQSRAAGSAPTPNVGGSGIALGGRVRFVGKATVAAVSSSSSSSPGPGIPQGVFVTIRYTLIGRR